MMKHPRYQYRLYRTQFIGLGAAAFCIAAVHFYTRWERDSAPQNLPPVQFSSPAALTASTILAEFNPNDLDAKQWQNLGFSARQAAMILKYKQIVGGAYTSKQQLKKCYGISPENYARLAPFIDLPEKNAGGQAYAFKKKFEKKEIVVPGKFNPDHFSEGDFVKMGFTERQAAGILKYRAMLGGSFGSKEKFRNCYMISEDNYRKMEPYILLPDTAPDKPATNRFTTTAKPAILYHDFDPNTTDLQGWQSLGFSEKQAAVIINYRDHNLRGSFRTLEDVKKCIVISDKKFEEIAPYIRLNPEHFVKNQGYAVSVQQPAAKTDFSNSDINTLTFRQLKEFGLDDHSAASIIGFRKKLGGFVEKSQVLETYNIDKEMVSKLLSTAKISTENVPKYSLVDAPEDWLRNHPYFKYFADKIIYYRETEKNPQKIIKFLKLKPEQEARMKLYLK